MLNICIFLLSLAASGFSFSLEPIPLKQTSGDDQPNTNITELIDYRGLRYDNNDDIFFSNPQSPSSPSGSYFVGRQKVSWFEAHYLCQQYGMELATVESAKEEAEIEKLLAPEESGNGFWISATRLGSCNIFVFFKTGKPVIYHKFASGQPDNAGGKEACVEIFKHNDSEIYWNDIPCDSADFKKKYICQPKS